MLMSDAQYLVTVDCDHFIQKNNVKMMVMEKHKELIKFSQERLKREGIEYMGLYSWEGCKYTYLCILSDDILCSLLLQGFIVHKME